VSATCQVDFYVLGASAPSAGHLACRLCLRAWEQGHRVSVLASDEQDAHRLDRLMWEFPAGRFLPHEVGEADSAVPVAIIYEPKSLAADRHVIVNLSPGAIPEPARFERLLEIVPADSALRESSRDKFRVYRSQGLKPNHHQMQAF